MSTEFKKFLYKIILLSLILLILGSAFFYFSLQKFYFPAFPALFPVFIIVSGFSHYILINSAIHNQLKFNTAFMLSFIVKIFVYSLFVAISLYIDKTNYVSFVVTTMLFYIIYTVFDVVQILNFIKNNKSDIEA